VPHLAGNCFTADPKNCTLVWGLKNRLALGYLDSAPAVYMYAVVVNWSEKKWPTKNMYEILHMHQQRRLDIL